MQPSYNRIAGQQLERIAGLSDGIFAVAMTLIVLEIRIPEHATVTSEGDLWAALLTLAPQVATYLMSFLTLGIFWVGQQTQLSFCVRADRNLAWIQFLFLAAVATMPFSTSLLSHYVTFRTALIVYWLNIVALGGALFVSWNYASSAGLLRDTATAEISSAVRRRIVVAQGLYAFGAALCAISTYLSMGFIVIVQLYYAIAPRLPKFARALDH